MTLHRPVHHADASSRSLTAHRDATRARTCRRWSAQLGVLGMVSLSSPSLGCTEPIFVADSDAGADLADAAVGCAALDCPADAPCTKTPSGAPRCGCPEGYTLVTADEGASCHDVDECLGEPCSYDTQCLNRPGGYECTCPVNSAFSYDSGECVPNDECVDGLTELERFTVDLDGDGQAATLVRTERCLYRLELRQEVLLVPREKVEVEIVPGSTSRFDGFAECPSPDGARCTARPEQRVSARLELMHNVAFVTSATYTGNLGGKAGADALCEEHARAAGIHGERFVAVLSDSDLERAADARGWVRLDGRPVLDRTSDEHFLWPVTMTSFSGSFDPDRAPWFSDADARSCAGFSSGSSSARATSVDPRSVLKWRVGEPSSCDQQRPLLCLGLGQDAAIPHIRYPGRMVFLADGAWDGSPETAEQAVAQADEACRARACALSTVSDSGDTCDPDTAKRFKALISSTTRSAASRFSNLSGMWVRSDGVPWAASPAALNGARLITGLPEAPSGVLVGFEFSPVNVAQDAETSCDDWTRLGTTQGMAYGFDASLDTIESRLLACETPRFLCLEDAVEAQ